MSIKHYAKNIAEDVLLNLLNPETYTGLAVDQAKQQYRKAYEEGDELCGAEGAVHHLQTKNNIHLQLCVDPSWRTGLRERSGYGRTGGAAHALELRVLQREEVRPVEARA